MEHLIEAKVIDERHLRLKDPLLIPPGSTVMISIESSETIAEDQEWYSFSLENLEIAYGDEEPDYTLDRVKEFNPEYRP